MVFHPSHRPLEIATRFPQFHSPDDDDISPTNKKHKGTLLSSYRGGHFYWALTEDKDFVEKFSGVVEVDETYVGGKRKGRRGRGAASKVPVIGMVGYPFDSGSHKMLWSRESIYQEANPEVTALARRGAA